MPMSQKVPARSLLKGKYIVNQLTLALWACEDLGKRSAFQMRA